MGLLAAWFVWEGLWGAVTGKLEIHVNYLTTSQDRLLTGLPARLYGSFLAGLGAFAIYHLWPGLS